MQVSKKAPEEQHEGIPATPVSKSASSRAQLKCLYANTHNMENKQGKLEMCACLQDYDFTGITKRSQSSLPVPKENLKESQRGSLNHGV